MKQVILMICLFSVSGMMAQDAIPWQGKFEQLGQELPTPNVYRTGDGSPGPAYWQQKADYKIAVELDDKEQKVTGSQVVTYFNKSPQPLSYLWLQIEQNSRTANNPQRLTNSLNLPDSLSGWVWKYLRNEGSTEGGMHITTVTDKNNKALPYQIQNTMMRIDLPQPLQPGKKFVFKTSWWYNLNNRMEDRGRSGYEYFPADGNYSYAIAQFYPRMAVYDDFEGWQNKAFLGAGEFALTFGDFEVAITTPKDHLLMATGELQNAKEVLNKTQYERYELAKKSFDKPVIIASQKEAIEREAIKSAATKTWKFKAENVRDFSFGSSRKFIWDAQAIKIGKKIVLAQSLYPKEGNPLWEKESTRAVINTLKTYSKYSIDYPYPHATSVHAASIGMEYPMICYNYGRPKADGSYTEATRFDMLGVVIHEVGHNFFPMIVNSDERQWTWMDEGINSFLEYLTEQECYDDFPSSRGPAASIIPYMQGNKRFIRPIMTNSEQVMQLGNNAYGKPATALNILRETILGRETFDKAFKTYSERWAFKHPKPADFFRSMEDAAGVDLDWFWRGWFYSTDHVDIAVDTMIWYQTDGGQHLTSLPSDSDSDGGPSATIDVAPISQARAFSITETTPQIYGEFMDRLDDDAVSKELSGKEIYKIVFENKGGLVMPIIIEFNFESGKKERIKIPAEIWRRNEAKAAQVFVFDEKVKDVILDPDLETADVDTENNTYPRVEKLSKLESFKSRNN